MPNYPQFLINADYTRVYSASADEDSRDYLVQQRTAT
jgi:hypothetical protein